MQLTTKQIQEIDNRLKRNGIVYWDIRIEMLDHVVTDVENRLEKGEKLENAITNSFIDLGWNGSLKQLNREGWQNVNEKYRREYHKGIIRFFKSLKNTLLFFVGLITLYFLSSVLTFNIFKKVCMILFISPIFLVIYLYVKTLFKKYGKSVNLDYGFFYLTLNFMILPGIFSLFKSQPELSQKIVWIVVLSIHFLSIHSGYHLYKKSIEKVENLRKQLLQ